MFYLDASGVYRSTLLDALPWLRHGFGTRLSGPEWPPQLAFSLKQIHSDRVLTADGLPAGVVGPGDAVISHHRPGAFLAVRTADCVPVLLAESEHRAIGAIHAGWRGTVANICAKTVRAMIDSYGVDPRGIRAAIGPAIGPCCFEVGPEVARGFQTIFPNGET